MDPIQYLSEKVSKVVVDSDKVYNHGAYLLASYPLWEYDIDRFVYEAWDTLLRYCIRNKQSKYSAAVKLTFSSNLLGQRIARDIGIDDTNVKSTLSLGDLFLEAFLQDNLIDIFREYEGRKAPYILRITNLTDNVKPILLGTVFEKPEPIQGLISQITKDPYIKGWTNQRLFHEHLNTPFVKSLEILRQQPWKLNLNVLHATKKNPPPESLELITEDGEIITYNIHNDIKDDKAILLNTDGTPFLGKKDPKLQRLISKYFEYKQIIGKAELIGDREFFQEVSCDYRGRVYYSESFVEFQGSDLARSLFLFSNKKKVTEIGFRWLCIHTASCFNQSYTIDELRINQWTTSDYIEHLEKEGLDTISVDKMTLEDRAKWCTLNSSMIRDTAEGLLLNSKAEKPHSFLAGCLEISAYEDAVFAGITYESGLPIPIDGSSNGSQHLAAISKDAHAGELVSLLPNDIPKDFYVAVAKELVSTMPDWFSQRAMPMKDIRKGIAKRGSMTRAYSAGKKKISSNMYNDLHVEGFTKKYDISEDDCDKLATGLISAINTVCNGQLKTAKLLQKIAEHELASGRNHLTWVTPSGFPVVYKAYLQHERKQRSTIKGIIGNKDGRINHVIKVNAISKETKELIPCRRSFASGISPNFVHSLDASHMANTIGIFNGSFAAVHDSFSSHAEDIDFLQEVTKMTFVAQYDVPNFFTILKNMLMESEDSFTYPEPELGTLDLSLLKDSKYFFC